MSKSKGGRLALAAVSAGAAAGVGLITPAAHAAGTVVSVANDAELAAALSGQSAGEEIEVQTGTYATAVTIAADNVTLKAAGAVTLTKQVTITGNGDVLDGFTISGSPTYGVNVKAGSTATIENNRIDGNGNSGIYVKNAVTGTKILHNEASGNTNASKRVAAGVEVHGDHTTVAGNVLHDNQDSGVEFYDDGVNNHTVPNGANYGVAVNNAIWHNGDHGIDNLAVNHGYLANNTIFDNCTSGINIEGGVNTVTNQHSNPGGQYAVVNNIVFDNVTDATCAHGPQGVDKNGQPGQIRVADDQVNGITVDHNLVYLEPSLVPVPAVNYGSALYVWSPVVSGAANITAYTDHAAFFTALGQAQHDVNANPALTSTDVAHLNTVNLRPTATSVNVNGQATLDTSVTGYAGVDADWSSRTNPTALGAYEFGAAPGTPPSAPLPPVTGGGTPPGSPPPASMTVNQIGGNDRYATGLLVSQHRWQAGQANAVVLATGRNFADALAGVPLAAKVGGPLLLLDGASGAVDPAVYGEISRVLKPGGQIYILGGTAAVSQGIETQLRGVFPVTRYQGENRYLTSVDIATRGLGSPNHVVVATGNGFADALASGPFATGPFADGPGAPAAILLTNDKTLDPHVAGYLANKDMANVATIGRQAATAVPAAARSYAGNDRFETDQLVAGAFTGAAAGNQVGVADGMNYPDALTGGAYMASLATPGPVVLLDGVNKAVPPQAAAVLDGRRTDVEADMFGGPNVITPAMSSIVVAHLAASTVIHIGF